MIKPDAQIVKQLAAMARQFPDVVLWLEEWEMHELRKLPQAANSTAIFQGRCQVLNEITKLIKDSPALAAKL